MGFHLANFGLPDLSIFELCRGTRQTDGQSDTARSFYNVPSYGGRGKINGIDWRNSKLLEHWKLPLSILPKYK